MACKIARKKRKSLQEVVREALAGKKMPPAKAKKSLLDVTREALGAKEKETTEEVAAPPPEPTSPTIADLGRWTYEQGIGDQRVANKDANLNITLTDLHADLCDLEEILSRIHDSIDKGFRDLNEKISSFHSSFNKTRFF